MSANLMGTIDYILSTVRAKTTSTPSKTLKRKCQNGYNLKIFTGCVFSLKSEKMIK